ncbi:5-formyltetrahydrofolate cyclo-ligase [Nakamurella alba]|nr:5-formyltetrahydrofolate cyclo-ligase [Nakamurella alba]
MTSLTDATSPARPASDGSVGSVAEAKAAQDALRTRVWPALRQVARPHPLLGFDFDNFIADFEGSGTTAELIRELPAYRAAHTVFVTPDESTGLLRQRVLEDGKTLVVTSFGISTGFRRVRPDQLPDGGAEQAATMDWLHEVAPVVRLAELAGAGVSLLVTGAGAVADGGVRLGKGHGYFDLEWAMLSEIGALADDPVVVGVVHDCQRLAVRVPVAEHDVPLDLVVTPTGVEQVAVHRSPGRVLWPLLTVARAAGMPPVVELALLRAGAMS